ncbi:DNA translocase FtsK 4TM domain-containing protein [Alphaproteobacteria bacterium]|nr:DNA translocase FtsK 4TM domain-containing protein [Alphaproteobacteria bacterium]
MKIINKEEIIRFSYSLVILLLFVCSVLSLVSSHENDNNIFKHNSSVTEVRNILGPFGANFSALLFKSLGTISFYIPIVLFCWLIKIIVVKKIPNTLNASFLPISILLLCALTSILENSEFFRFKFVDVGFVGEGIYELLSSYQGIYLTYLVQNNLLFLSIFLLINEPVSKEDILSNVWKHQRKLETHTLESLVYRLRLKIEKDPKNPKILKLKGKKYFINMLY